MATGPSAFAMQLLTRDDGDANHVLRVINDCTDYVIQLVPAAFDQLPLKAKDIKDRSGVGPGLPPTRAKKPPWPPPPYSNFQT